TRHLRELKQVLYATEIQRAAEERSSHAADVAGFISGQPLFLQLIVSDRPSRKVESASRSEIQTIQEAGVEKRIDHRGCAECAIEREPKRVIRPRLDQKRRS